MLDENTVIPKSRLAVLDWTVFVRDCPGEFPLLDNLRLLSHRKTPTWNIILVYNELHLEVGNKAKEFCRIFDIPLMESICVRSGQIQNYLYVFRAADIVYAPTMEVLLDEPAGISVLRVPRNSRQAIEAICYFSSCPEPFTPDNYYSFLKQTDGTTTTFSSTPS